MIPVETFGAIVLATLGEHTAQIVPRTRVVGLGGDDAFVVMILESLGAIRPAIGTIAGVISLARFVARSVTVLQGLVALGGVVSLASAISIAPADIPGLVAGRVMVMMIVSLMIMTVMIVLIGGDQSGGGNAQDHEEIRDHSFRFFTLSQKAPNF